MYERPDGTWGWRLVADNQEIIAVDGGQGYENAEDCRAMADSIIGGDYRDADKRILRAKRDS